MGSTLDIKLNRIDRIFRPHVRPPATRHTLRARTDIVAAHLLIPLMCFALRLRP